MMGFCEYEKHTGTGLAVLIRSLLWRRKKNEKKRYSLTFSSVEKEAKRHSPHQGHIFLTTIQPSCLYSLTFFDTKKEAKKYSPHQGLPSGGGCNTRNRSAPSISLRFGIAGHAMIFL